MANKWPISHHTHKNTQILQYTGFISDSEVHSRCIESNKWHTLPRSFDWHWFSRKMKRWGRFCFFGLQTHRDGREMKKGRTVPLFTCKWGMFAFMSCPVCIYSPTSPIPAETILHLFSPLLSLKGHHLFVCFSPEDNNMVNNSKSQSALQLWLMSCPIDSPERTPCCMKKDRCHFYPAGNLCCLRALLKQMFEG